MWVHPVTLVIGMIINERDHHVGGRVRPPHTHKHTCRVVYCSVSIACVVAQSGDGGGSTTEAAARETGRFGRLLRSKSCERRVASFWDSKSPENPRYARFWVLPASVPCHVHVPIHCYVASVAARLFISCRRFFQSALCEHCPLRRLFCALASYRTFVGIASCLAGSLPPGWPGGVMEDPPVARRLVRPAAPPRCVWYC